ncbi:FHA domain-containing protein OS=Streptomyces alboniger OX=132473 GN=CP975_10485 PE=4 SV=1 [Streptomyces alboniger]
MLELTMAAVSAADAAPRPACSWPTRPVTRAAVLRLGRDKSVCRLSTPDDWLFIFRVHLEFLCGPEGTWQVTWLQGSQPDPSSEVRLTVGEYARPLSYGGTVPLPQGGSGEIIIQDRTAPRSVNVGFYHEV